MSSKANEFINISYDQEASSVPQDYLQVAIYVIFLGIKAQMLGHIKKEGEERNLCSESSSSRTNLLHVISRNYHTRPAGRIEPARIHLDVSDTGHMGHVAGSYEV